MATTTVSPDRASVEHGTRVTVADVLGAGFPDAANVRHAAKMFTSSSRTEYVRAAARATYQPLEDGSVVNVYTGEVLTDLEAALAVDGETSEGPSFFLMVTPGVVQLRAQDLAKAERRATVEGLPVRLGADLEESSLHQHIYGDAARLVDEWHISRRAAEREIAGVPGAPARAVTEWSARSRAHMIRSIASRDWKPFFRAGARPAMLTLTYSDSWEIQAPSGAVVKGHLEAFKSAWFRRWGAPIRGTWKLEFQGRGAPHVHMLIPVPWVSPAEFKAWAAKTWAAIVARSLMTREGLAVDEIEAFWHSCVGASVDYSKSASMANVRAVSLYFAGHSLKTTDGKEYQHIVPEAWRTPGDGPGRFWGIWGLELVVAGVELSPAQYVAARRLLRRWSAAKSRRTLCRGGRLSGGWAVVGSGPRFAADLSRALALP